MSGQPEPCDERESMNVYQRLVQVMRDVGYVKKTGQVQFGSTRYKAVQHDVVVAHVRPALIRWGVFPHTTVGEHRSEVRETTDNKGKPRNSLIDCVSVAVTFINMDVPNDRTDPIVCYGTGIDFGDKATGKAISMAYKYCLLKGLALETGDDEESRVAVLSNDPPAPQRHTPSDNGGSPRQRLYNTLRQWSGSPPEDMSDVYTSFAIAAQKQGIEMPEPGKGGDGDFERALAHVQSQIDDNVSYKDYVGA